MSTDVDTNPPRNSVAKGGWWTIFGLGFVTWGFAVASIGIGKHEHRILLVRFRSHALHRSAASAYVKYKNLKNSITEAAAPATIEITSPGTFLSPGLSLRIN